MPVTASPCRTSTPGSLSHNGDCMMMSIEGIGCAALARCFHSLAARARASAALSMALLTADSLSLTMLLLPVLLLWTDT